MRPIVRRSLAAAILAAAALDVLAEEFGTLFTTPEERARLDRLRRGDPTAAAATPDAALSRHKPALTGYVQRSDGRNTVWIDGRPVVVAAPGPRSALEPGMVQPRSSERVIRVEETDKPKP